MACKDLLFRLGYECHDIGDNTIVVDTPFTFADGETIGFYLVDEGDKITVHDNADTLAHFEGLGFDITSRQRWTRIRNEIDFSGFVLEDSGIIIASRPRDREQSLIADYLGALLAIAGVEREYLGLSEEQIEYVDEVEAYLKASKPTAELTREVSVEGHSGRPHTFHFRFDGKLVEAAKPHGRRTGTILRKALDVINAQRGEPILVVMDDRTDPDRAKIETDILHNTVSVVQFTSLARQAVVAPTRH